MTEAASARLERALQQAGVPDEQRERAVALLDEAGGSAATEGRALMDLLKRAGVAKLGQRQRVALLLAQQPNASTTAAPAAGGARAKHITRKDGRKNPPRSRNPSRGWREVTTATTRPPPTRTTLQRKTPRRAPAILGFPNGSKCLEANFAPRGAFGAAFFY